MQNEKAIIKLEKKEQIIISYMNEYLRMLQRNIFISQLQGCLLKEKPYYLCTLEMKVSPYTHYCIENR